MKDFVGGIISLFFMSFACTAGVYGGVKAVDAIEEKVKEKKLKKKAEEVCQYVDDDFLE